MGNLNTLFSLAYDRGGKVVEMIHNRLGEVRFFAFFHKLYTDYSYKTLYYADFKRELIAFDPKGDWGRFLENWVEKHSETDWAVQHVQVGPASKTDADVRQVTVELEQRGQMTEPTVVLCRCPDGELRVPIWPDRQSYEVPGAQVQRQGKRWVVTMDAPEQPSQIEVDPDHALLDAQPDNNRWKPEISWRSRGGR